MNKVNSQKTKEYELDENETPSFFVTILLAAIVGFVPLVVYWRLVDYRGVIGDLLNKSSSPDFFVFYKAAWIYLLTGAGVLWFLAYRQFSRSHCPRSLVVYSAMAVTSTAFAVYSDLAFYGDPQRFEGVFMHLAYMAIVFLFMNLVSSRFAVRTIMSSLLFSSGIISLLGVLQFFGHDYFFSPYGGFMLMPEHFRQSIESLATTVDTSTPTYSVFATFGNRNFAGIYIAMLFPLSLGLFLGIEGWRKTLLFCLNSLLYAGLLSCSARAAILSSACASLLTLSLLRSKIFRQAGWILALLSVYCIVPFVFDAFTLRHDLPRYFSESVGRPLMHSVGTFGVFRDLQLSGDSAVADFDGIKMTIRYNGGDIEFYDASGTLVPHRMIDAANSTSSISAAQAFNAAASSAFTGSAVEKAAPGIVNEASGTLSLATGAYSGAAALKQSTELEPGYLVVFPRTRLPGYLIQAWPDHSILRIGRGGVNFYLGYTENGFKLLGSRGTPLEISDVKAWGFNGREGFGSGRGYIWSRSLPLLRQTLLVGFGPDTFMAHFPNHDYLGKLKHWANGLAMMIEKPHNLYLQIAINLGGIALLAMLVLWCQYLLESLRLYFKSDFSNGLEVIGISIFAAVFSYLVDGLFNDSIVGVAQVFWALLGMGFAVNRMVIAERTTKNQQSEESSPVSAIQEG